MYVYFDKDGVLKEIITERPFRAGDSQRDKIYIFVEDVGSPNAGWVKYKLPNGSKYPSGNIEQQFYNGGALTYFQIPTDPVRNLKYFSYDHTCVVGGVTKVGYLGFVIEVPDAVLDSSLDDEDVIPTQNNMVGCLIRLVNSGISAFGMIVFSVETSMGIITDSSINVTQYNYLVSLFNNVYNLDTVPTEGSIKGVQSGGVYNAIAEGTTVLYFHDLYVLGRLTTDAEDVGYMIQLVTNSPDAIETESDLDDAVYYAVSKGGYFVSSRSTRIIDVFIQDSIINIVFVASSGSGASIYSLAFQSITSIVDEHEKL